MAFDLVVRNGTVVTASDVFDADIGVTDGRIAEIGGEIDRGAREIDARGRLVLPGCVDVHTHLSKSFPLERRDDFESGSRAAAAGGVTTVCDFSAHLPGQQGLEIVLDDCRDAEAKSIVDFSFHFLTTGPSEDTIAELPALIDAGFSSLKVFVGFDYFAQAYRDFLKLFEVAAGLGMVLAVHAEDDTLCEHSRDRLLGEGKTETRYFPDSRPPVTEAVSTAQAVAIGEITGIPVYLVHLSCARALEVARAARARGQRVFVETRPTYLHLTAEEYHRPGVEANKFVCLPPLRDESDREALWNGLRAGDIDTVATDHTSPPGKLEPSDTFATVGPGGPNLQTVLPMLHSDGVVGGRLSLNRMVAVLATNPARLFGMYPRKGTIAVGSDADIVVFDVARRETVGLDRMESRADFEVYEGREVQGWPDVTISRGEVIYEDGKVVADPGRGRRVPRGLFTGL